MAVSEKKETEIENEIAEVRSCEREKNWGREKNKTAGFRERFSGKMGRKGENEMGGKKKMQEREKIARERERGSERGR